MIAEPLEKGIADDIQSGRISMKMPIKELSNHFQQKHGWDLLASRSIWAFGPDEQNLGGGANVLLNDTLADQVGWWTPFVPGHT